MLSRMRLQFLRKFSVTGISGVSHVHCEACELIADSFALPGPLNASVGYLALPVNGQRKNLHSVWIPLRINPWKEAL